MTSPKASSKASSASSKASSKASSASSKASSKASSASSKSSSPVIDVISTLSFKDLIEYNLKFLNGKLIKTFYHLGPVDEETVPLLDKLKAINAFGFFTIEGQPSLCNEHQFTSKTLEVNGKTQGNWWYKSEQKSYLIGFIEKKESNLKLVEYLRKNPKVYTTTATKDGKYESNLPDGCKKYNVTRVASRASENATWSKWILNTNIWNINVFDDYDIKAFNDCLYITIAVKNYCEDSVEDILLDYYNNLK